MSGPAEEFALRRIAVGLDASERSLEALATAVDLAARCNAELVGLFIEDINLVRLADLEVARQIVLPTGVAASRPEMLAAELRMLARECRRALEAAAEQAHLRWSFSVSRGRVGAEIVAASATADLLVLGRTSRPLGPCRRLGSTVRAVLLQGSRPLLLLGHCMTRLSTLLVVYDAVLPGNRALRAAARLRRSGMGPLTVLLPAGSAAQTLRECAEEHLASEGIGARCTPLPCLDGATLLYATAEVPGALLVLSADSEALRGQDAAAVLEAVEGPVLLVR
ncbi:MAG: universal stress protein [Myxococcota bacterium]|nr:universal stress protein [Myxococcota bacterium]